MSKSDKGDFTSKETLRLNKWKSEFLQDFKVHSTWCTKKKSWEDFYDGEQLSQEEKEALQKRGQPEVVINMIGPRIDSVVGDFLERRVMMRAFDKGSGDFEKAKYITEALRYVEEMNRFDEAEAEVANELFISGQGWYKLNLEFDFLEPEIKISYRPNSDIVLDRRCKRRDLKDAKRLWETVWVEVEDLIELYPDFEHEITNAVDIVGNFNSSVVHEKIGDDYGTGLGQADSEDWESFVDAKRKRIRLINVWERVQKRVEFAFHPSLEGGVVELSKLNEDERSTFNKVYPDAQTFVRNQWELNSGMFIYNCILEDKKNVRPHDSDGKFPFSRALGKVNHADQMPYGMVKQYIDAQKEYNKRRSKLLHKTNTNRIVAAQGAVEDIEVARREAARADGYIEHAQGLDFQIDGSEPAQADIFLLELSRGEVESSGVAREFTGQEDKVMSGKAIALRQVAADRMLRRYYAALRSARRSMFELALEEIQQFWTSEKLIKITDDPQAQGMVLNQRVTDEFGNVVIINNLRLGKYDIKIDEDTESVNQRQENFDRLVQLAPSIIQSGQPFPVEILIGYSDMPDKEKLIQSIQLEKERQMQMMQMQAIAGAGQSGNARNA